MNGKSRFVTDPLFPFWALTNVATAPSVVVKLRIILNVQQPMTT